MITKNSLVEDLQLKQVASTPRDQKPRFDWKILDDAIDGIGAKKSSESSRGNENNAAVLAASKGSDSLLSGQAQELTQLNRSLRILDGDNSRSFDLSELADAIGSALTDLLISRNEEDIYNEKNQRLVSDTCRAVAKELAQRSENGEFAQDGALYPEEINRITESVLIRHNAFDLAKSLLLRKRYLQDSLESMEDQPPIAKVIRRSGEVVTWNPQKVEIAVRKAFLELELDPNAAHGIAKAVTEDMATSDLEFIGIEDVQDRVQEQLMKQGHYRVAEAYILYRAHRGEMRLEETSGEESPSQDAQESLILINKKDGSSELWDGADLRKRIEFASLDLDLCLSTEEIEVELRRSVYAEMSEEELRKTITLNSKSLTEKDADFSKFAARILLSYIYEEVLGWNIVIDGINALPEFHRRAFKRNIHRAVELDRIHESMLSYDLDRLADCIDANADLELDYLGVQTLYDRYLIIDKESRRASEHRRLETPQLFWMRVSMGLFREEEENKHDKVVALYKLYKGRRFCSSTPTLFNSGTNHSQLSSCYLYKVDDSIESIMQRGIAENAYLSKWAGGLGGSWTAVRGTGSYIKGTNGESQGVIPFLKLHNDQLIAVNQGGKRRGSGCAYMETWHNDLPDFLELRKNVGDDRRRAHDMNTANWIPDLFMKRMEARENWTFFRSNEVPDLHDSYGAEFEQKYLDYEAQVQAGEIWGESRPTIDVWKSMLKMIFETGHPWITFKDACNLRSPQDHCGVIHSSNLCTEITLNTSEEETAVCNLGSVVLDNHLDSEGEIDHKKLRETIRTAVRALDNVIDINFYPTEAAKTANQRHRPIGLGIMGLQNALYQREQSFASQEAVEFNDEFMEAIAYYAYEASSDLAKERGAYSTFKGSKWDRGLLPADTIDLLEENRGDKIEVHRGSSPTAKVKLDWDALRKKIGKQGMRNSNVLAIAPTATISNIMGSSPCIEPLYKNLFVKSNLAGDFTVLNSHLVRDLKKLGLWDAEMCNKLKYHNGELSEIQEIPDELKQRYLTAFGVPYEFIIEAAARRQKWIDQSQSLNLFLPEPDLKSLSHMYRMAWRKGLKTTYYLRTMAASDIEKSTVDEKKEVRGAVASGAAGSGKNQKAEATLAEVQACRLDAMINGEECEACQ